MRPVQFTPFRILSCNTESDRRYCTIVQKMSIRNRVNRIVSRVDQCDDTVITVSQSHVLSSQFVCLFDWYLIFYSWYVSSYQSPLAPDTTCHTWGETQINITWHASNAGIVSHNISSTNSKPFKVGLFVFLCLIPLSSSPRLHFYSSFSFSPPYHMSI